MVQHLYILIKLFDMKKLLLLLITLKCSLNLFAATDNTRYPLVIEFHSFCCGVPNDAPLLKYIAGFKKKYKIKKIAYDRIGPLGREGEYDMAFSLRELNKKQAGIFIKEVKLIVADLKDRGGADAEENISVEMPGSSVKKKMAL